MRHRQLSPRLEQGVGQRREQHARNEDCEPGKVDRLRQAFLASRFSGAVPLFAERAFLLRMEGFAVLSGPSFAADVVRGQPIRDLVTVNGVRVTVEDGTWGLVRASSNKPELVVVVESPVSEERMREMFKGVDAVLRRYPEVGAYNQTI